ncbi:hypothetical protein, partial [Burkholderia multivorans]|uniref:hypothetical protein n=1 Tax=Burkholderia multivorans TaxID=87883 RepID=UPI001C614E5A
GLIPLFPLAPISRLTSRFVDESRFCFRPSTEHRATQHDRGGRADLHGREKRARRSSAPAAAKRSAPGRYHGSAQRFCTVPRPAIRVKANRRWPKRKIN